MAKKTDAIIFHGTRFHNTIHTMCTRAHTRTHTYMRAHSERDTKIHTEMRTDGQTDTRKTSIVNEINVTNICSSIYFVHNSIQNSFFLFSLILGFSSHLIAELRKIATNIFFIRTE
jgi:hypothetical protein